MWVELICENVFFNECVGQDTWFCSGLRTWDSGIAISLFDVSLSFDTNFSLLIGQEPANGDYTIEFLISNWTQTSQLNLV